MTYVLKATNFSFSYDGDQLVLKDIDLVVEAGICAGIVGANGAGKTTLIKAIQNHQKKDHQSHGNLTVTGPMQVLYDSPQVYSYLRGHEYVRLILGLKELAYDERLKEVQRHSQAFGLTDAMAKLIADYSFGMKRKIYLLPFLVESCDFMVFDEPTNGLDTQSMLHLKGEILARKARGKTTLVTSHNIGFLEAVCDEVHLLNRNQIKATYERGGGQSLEDFYQEHI